MAARLREERYPAGEAIVAEGEASDRLFLIVSGTAEVTADGPSGPVPLAILGPGELFGEAGLLHSGGGAHGDGERAHSGHRAEYGRRILR